MEDGKSAELVCREAVGTKRLAEVPRESRCAEDQLIPDEVARSIPVGV